MNSGSGQDGSSQRGSGSAVPHRSGHRHSLSSSQRTHDSPWERPDAERIRPSSSTPLQRTSNNVAPVSLVDTRGGLCPDPHSGNGSKPRTATGRTRPVARKSTGMIPPRTFPFTPKRTEPAIEVHDSEDSDPAPLEEIRRRSGARHRNIQPAQNSPGRHAATTSSSNRGHRTTNSTSTQRNKPTRPTTFSRETLRRQEALPRPARNRPPPPGVEVVEISSDDEGPAPVHGPRTGNSETRTARPSRAFQRETIDLTIDDDIDEGVSTALPSAPAVSSSQTPLNRLSLHRSRAAGAPESTAPAIHPFSTPPSFVPIVSNPGPPPAFESPGLRFTHIRVSDGPPAKFEQLIPGDAPDVLPSNVSATLPPSAAHELSSGAIPRSTPRRSIPAHSPFATRLSPARTPVFLSDLDPKLPSHGPSSAHAPVRIQSPLAVPVHRDQAAQEMLDTPIDEEDHPLDVNMGDDGSPDNLHTSGSTPLQAPTTDDERPPSGTPSGEDMEIDANILEAEDALLSAGPVHVPAPVPAPNVVAPLLTSFRASPSRPLVSAPPEDTRPVVVGVTLQSPLNRSQSAPTFTESGNTTAPIPALHSTHTADESDVVEGTDVTMGTSSADERAFQQFHTLVLPRPNADFESSEDELAGDFASKQSSISAPISEDEEITPADTVKPSHPTEGLTDFAMEIYADILENNLSEAAYYAHMARKYPGEELDTRIVDMMNALPEPWKQDVTTKLAFESYMMSSVSAYNPWSPPITVINTVDAQPNPPWEFMYTERMVYGNGVKRPTKEERRARGCDCYPYCKPNDRTCACLRRQEKYGKEVELKGFRYNRDGLLTFPDTVPIFECTDGCHCNEDCPNRVAQFGRTKMIALEKTVNKGWGVVAMEAIPAGSFLGVYSGELLLPCELEVREAFYNTYGRTYTFEIDFHYLKQRGRKRGKKTSARYAIDAFHAGCFTRYLNHSCDPNCVIIPVVYGEATTDTPYLGFYTLFDVKEGEGLEFSYKGVPDEEQVTNHTRAARFRKKKERAIAQGQTFNTMNALCRCGAKNCDGSMWQWEQESDDGGGSSNDTTEGNERGEEGQMQVIGVLDDPGDDEYEGSDDEVDKLESDDEAPPRIEMV